MNVDIIEEPLLEFGYGATHVEQRAGIAAHGPADIAMEGRCDTLRLGLVGAPQAIEDVESYLVKSAAGLPGKETKLRTLFPDFPGCSTDIGFRAELRFSRDGRRAIGSKAEQSFHDAGEDSDKIKAAVELCASEIRSLCERSQVDVVMLARPHGIPEGVGEGGMTGSNFHDLLKAAVIDIPQPIQVIREVTWRGGVTVEDPATRAWNLFTALFYKAGGKPWRLLTDRSEPTRCFVGVSFARLPERDELFASVAQVFNELGDGVIVRGAIAERGESDRQVHLSRHDASALLTNALEQYRLEHGNLPAALTLHKTSAFSNAERDGFLEAAAGPGLSCDLLWLTTADDAMLVRGSKTYPPLRGTLLSLDDAEHLLYTHGSLPYYRTYPGLYIPRPLGIRPCVIERPIEAVASEILSLTKLNWNRARIEATWPITLLTSRRVGEILRHVPRDRPAAPRYAKYM